MSAEEHVYVVVRTDIPPIRQAVQACHAAHEAGASFYRPHGGMHFTGNELVEPSLKHRGSNLVLLAISSEEELMQLAKDLSETSIRFEMFFEPDYSMGWTALATEPISGKMRESFKKYKSLKF